jgi:hypothetical protein
MNGRAYEHFSNADAVEREKRCAGSGVRFTYLVDLADDGCGGRPRRVSMGFEFEKNVSNVVEVRWTCMCMYRFLIVH